MDPLHNDQAAACVSHVQAMLQLPKADSPMITAT